MREAGNPMRAIVGLAGAVILLLALGVLNGWMPAGDALAQDRAPDTADVETDVSLAVEALPVDLTGETCTGATKIIDGRTYCVMNGRLEDCEAIEIDDLDDDVSTAPDANLAPVDGVNLPAHTPSNPPCPGGAVYIDWADLSVSTLSPDGGNPVGSVEDHRILDWTAANDFTTLHGECLTDGSAHAKEDFTQSYLANNDKFLYFGQERRTNNGNSTFYWFLTHEPPILDTSVCTTGGDRGEVQFKLSQDDVRVVVAFSGSGGITIFTNNFTGGPTAYLPPKGTLKDSSDGAVFNPGWLGFQKPVKNLALNIADSPHAGDDGFAPWGGITNQGKIELDPGTFEDGEFAEWAVDLADVFPGGGNLCGQELFVTGISRAATGDPDKITESADLKDIIGPKLFSFGSISAEVILTPAPCGDSFTYEVITTGASGEIVPDSIQWTCTTDNGDPVTFDDGDPQTPDDSQVASGTATVPRKGDGTPHIVTCDVAVEAGGCGVTIEDEMITVEGSLLAITGEVDPVLLKCCTPGFPFGASSGNIPGGVLLDPIITGGSGAPYNVTWSFVPGNLGITCLPAPIPPDPTCTVQLPDSLPCASVGVVLRVEDRLKPECVHFNAEYGVIKKATILQFRQPPQSLNILSCEVLPPPAPVCVVP